MASVRWCAWWLLAASLVMLGACSGGQGLTLVAGLETDLVAGEEFDEVQLSLFALGGKGPARRLAVSAEERSFQSAEVLGELGGLRSGSYRVDLLLRDTERGRVVAERPLLVELSTNRAVTFPLNRSCLNVACPPLDDPATAVDESQHTACFGGVCVDPRCSVESPEFCGEARCDESQNGEAGNATCPATAGCARAECRGGACWFPSRPANTAGACEGLGEWCSPEASCLARGTDPGAAATTDSCADGVRNGNETAVDCGGSCDPCPLSSTVDAACRDGVQGPGETAVDCGGPCAPCPSSFDCASQSQIPIHECVALSQLFTATGGSTWNSSTGWLASQTPCSWFGVRCRSGHVSELNLSYNGLLGALPAALANLSELEVFDIEGSRPLGGAIPPELGLLSRLRVLAMNDCLFSGAIPAEIFSLSNLERLELRSSPLSGNLPKEIGALVKLQTLSLDSTALSGPLPKEIGQLSQLRFLLLSSATFSGALPAELGQLARLERFSIFRNSFSGPVPASLGNLQALVFADLSENLLSGEIPADIANASRLEDLRFTKNRLRGEVPASLMSMPALRNLDLRDNACLWTSDCGGLEVWLDGQDANWSRVEGEELCVPPEGACQ